MLHQNFVNLTLPIHGPYASHICYWVPVARESTSNFERYNTVLDIRRPYAGPSLLLGTGAASTIIKY